MSIVIEVDTVLRAAYIRLSSKEVARTVNVDEDVQIDLDHYGVAVGIELLDEQAPLPFAQLVEQFHVHSDVVELLRLIRPDVSTYLSFTRGNDGVSNARAADTLTSI